MAANETGAAGHQATRHCDIPFDGERHFVRNARYRLVDSQDFPAVEAPPLELDTLPDSVAKAHDIVRKFISSDDSC
jgi:hypothetical protein